jgi:UDP-N-acetyl-D-mannosaminuronic acid dehydrogenase
MMEAMMLKEKEMENPEERRNYVVTVVGCGRMGLPTACLFSDAGFKVVCLDADPSVVSQINKGASPFVEHGLGQLLKKNLKGGRISATTDPKEAISNSNIIILTVNTPIDEKKQPDYSNLESSCKNIGLNLKRGTLLIVESTVGPSVTETLVKETLEASSGLKAGADFGLAYSPIRATVGRTIKDITEYSKVVAGIDRQSLAATKAVLKTIIKGEMIDVANFRTAEAAKLFENVFRDVNISLANEFAHFCEKAGIDYFQVQKAANTQPFCHLLKPGIVSGHIPKDPYLLMSEAVDLGVKLKMTTLARNINDDVLKHAYNLVKDALRSCDKPVRRSRVAVLGVSYRPNVKEARGSLVPELVRLLKRMGARVNVFDPFFTYKELRDLGYMTEPTLGKTVENANCVLIAVGHNRFKRLTLGKINALMKKPSALVDLAHVVSPSRAIKEGFVYRGLGRGVWTK